MNTPPNPSTDSNARRSIMGHWVVGCTFLWALVGPLGLRYVVGWSQWLAIGFYPALCLAAGIFLLVGKRRSAPLAVVNFLCGLAWLVYAFVVIQAFIKGFAR